MTLIFLSLLQVFYIPLTYKIIPITYFLINIWYNPLYICSKLVGCFRIKQFWYCKLVFFVVFGLFHTSAFRIREKMFDQRKEVGFGRLFFIISVYLLLFTENLFLTIHRYQTDLLLHRFY